MGEIQKKRFEVKFRKHRGGYEKAVFIDGEKLDWAIDISSYRDAVSMGPKYREIVHQDIVKHFAESVSEVLGRKVTIQEIKKAIEDGWI